MQPGRAKAVCMLRSPPQPHARVFMIHLSSVGDSRAHTQYSHVRSQRSTSSREHLPGPVPQLPTSMTSSQSGIRSALARCLPRSAVSDTTKRKLACRNSSRLKGDLWPWPRPRLAPAP